MPGRRAAAKTKPSVPPPAAGSAPLRLQPAPPDAPRLIYQRGDRSPRAIAWFGLRSFWGHLWHLAASAIATEDIDSRDWMRADEPDELTERIAAELGGDPHAPTLTEALGEDLWIDFIADTGDCSAVSRSVARMLFAEYTTGNADDPALLPRGHLLIFGGDTAYPVATDLEIYRRVIVPFSRALRKVDNEKRRVLLGIPGNHDWYGGLDGFGRMFRRRRGSIDRASRWIGDVRSPEPEPAGKPIEDTERFGQLKHFVQWVEAFRIGTYVAKRTTLPLEGYTPVQSASYWALRAAPGLDLWGPDRQLRAVDFNQRNYFAEARGGAHDRGLVLCIADPARAFLETNLPGQQILDALELDVTRDGPLVLSGDTHHYCRERLGTGVHITAGGGGAFLHPARIRRDGVTLPDAEFPGPHASLALALQVPLQIAHGRSGFMVHAAIALLYSPAYFAELAFGVPSLAVTATTAIVSTIVCFFLGGWRTGKRIRIGLLALTTGLAVGFLPYALQWTGVAIAARLGGNHSTTAASLALAIAVYAGTLIFGGFLTLLTILGLEHHQALAALAHPGYKHFVRLRVRRDGSGVDGWAIGKVDPLDRGDPVVLIDRFFWPNPRARKAAEG